MRSLHPDGLTDVSPSRPGMGHSTDVPLRNRLNIWIELVPLLLGHLQIEHVTLVSHSAGTIYLLNTLIRCRNILHPNTPLVVLVGMVLILSINTIRW
jgi:pimeloyl-ACP methyl ester carboxylesterase